MKQIQFIDDNRNGFYIDNINNDIIVSSFGHSHLFNYPSILVKELDKFSKKAVSLLDKLDVKEKMAVL